jgi:hypothetical protein
MLATNVTFRLEFCFTVLVHSLGKRDLQPYNTQQTQTFQSSIIQSNKICPTTCHGGAWGERYSSYTFLTSGLNVGEWSASRPGSALLPGKDPSTHWIGGWVGLGAGLTHEARGKILCLCRGSNPSRPVCSQTLY